MPKLLLLVGTPERMRPNLSVPLPPVTASSHPNTPSVTQLVLDIDHKLSDQTSLRKDR